MMRYCAKVLVFAAASLAANSGLADVVPISISQNASDSGFVLICKLDTQSCEGSVGDSFSSSDGGSQAVSVSLDIRSLTAQAETSGGQSISADQFLVQLYASGLIYGFGSLLQAGASASSQYLLVFDLTNPSLVHLTGEVGWDVDFEASLFGNGSADAQILLTGPGFQFKQSCDGGFGCDNTFDELFSLDPGTYTLSAVAETSISVGHTIGGPSGEVFGDAGLSLNADFTAIPEPCWTPIVPALLVIGGCCIAGRCHARHLLNV